MSAKDIYEHFKKEGRVIQNAPWSFVFSVVLCGGIVFAIEQWHYDEILKTKDATVFQKDATIANISNERDRANRDIDKLAKEIERLRIYRGKDAPPLKSNALILSQQIREYIKDWKDTDPLDKRYPNVLKYVQRFGLRASIIRDDLDQNGQHSDEFDKVMFNFNSSYEEVRIIAAEIEKLANRLPD